MSEQLLDAICELNDNGVPEIGTCTVIIGDGTMKVDFVNGRGKVPASWAHLLARDSRIQVYGLDQVTETEATFDETAAPKGTLEVPRETTAEEIELAKQHLASEGEDVPDVEIANPKPDASVQGRFEASTTDGQPRCQAAKADGTQCANPAKAGDACQLPKHQGQLAG